MTKKILSIIFLGFLWINVGFTDDIYDSAIYLKCEGTPHPTNFVLLPKVKVVMVPDASSNDGMDRIPLKVTPNAYNFEYIPEKGQPIKFIISIDKFTGALNQTLVAGYSENNASKNYKGNCLESKF
tara:strand:- start:248 stop:625 length:378 start_codon:yes stop_codon:yes gene_type:complete